MFNGLLGRLPTFLKFTSLDCYTQHKPQLSFKKTCLAARSRDLIPICSFRELDMIIMKEHRLKEHPTVVVSSFSQPPIPIPMTITTTNLWSKQAGFL